MIQFGLVDSVLMFFAYSFVGWVVEVIYHGINKGKFINRGFLNGPLCPVYGFGFLGVIVALLPVEDNFTLLFFGSMIITTFIEFIAGFILYKIFALRWWDYRDRKFNIMGFICLRFSIYWGIACALAMKTLYPTVLFILDKTPFVIKLVLLSIFVCAFIFDAVDTVIGVIGFKKKLNLVTEISTEIRYVSDRIGGKIYDQVETVMTKSAPTIENYEEYKKLYQSHREEEKKLYKTHQEEEKALLEKLLREERNSLIATREEASLKLKQTIESLKNREKRIVSRIHMVNDDKITEGLELMKKGGEKK